MKRILVIALSLLFCLLLFGCDNNTDINKTDSATNPIDLLTVDDIKNIAFENTHIEIGIYTDENYYFSNRNQDFYEKFTAFLEKTKFSSQQMEKPDSKSFYVSIYDGENLASFSVYENDVIGGFTIAQSRYYYCAGIYREFESTFGDFLEENQKYCRSAHTPISHMTEYAVFDKNGEVLESDFSTENPYLFYDSGIVHMWAQHGTGTLTRCGKFFDVEKGSISPDYYGQTDHFGDLVSTTCSDKVVIYKMFTGEQICVFDQFEKPLADCIENICSAYFTKDGTQIVVEYLNAEFEKETQRFNLSHN